MSARRTPHRIERFHALSGFRFLLAAHILAFHFAPAPKGSVLLTRLLAGGYVATSALFVLSGFVLASVHPGPLSREERRQFWVARLARIYPAYLLAWALCLVGFVARASSLGGDELATRLSAAVLSLALVQAWVPSLAPVWNNAGWAASAVVFFYAVFPFAISRLARASSRSLVAYAVGFWLAGLLVPALLLAVMPQVSALSPANDGLPADFLKYDPALRAPEFLFGCAVGLLHGRGALRGGGLLALAGLLLLYLPTAGGGLPYVLLHNGLLAPAVALVLVGLASGAGPLARTLSSRPFVALGEAGFAIYVLQFPLHGIADHLAGWAHYDPSSSLAFGSFAVVTVATAFMVSRWFEIPMRRALRRAWGLDRGTEANPAAPPALGKAPRNTSVAGA